MSVLLLFSFLFALFQVAYYRDLIYVILLTVYYSDFIFVILSTMYFCDRINCRFRQFNFSILSSVSVQISLTRLESQH